jgi:hypothetical protein
MSKAIKEKKRPLTAYNFFCQSNDLRESIQKEHTDWSSALILKELGSKWKNLSDEEREPFNVLAIKEKEEFKEYKKANPSLDSNYNYEQVLKRPKSSYMHFSNDVDIREGVKNAHPECKVTQIASHLGSLWNKMSADEKKIWEGKAILEKQELLDNPIYKTKKKKKELLKSNSDNRLDYLEKILMELKHDFEQLKLDFEIVKPKLE